MRRIVRTSHGRAISCCRRTSTYSTSSGESCCGNIPGAPGSGVRRDDANGRLCVIPKLEDGSETVLSRDADASSPRRLEEGEATAVGRDKLLVVKPGDEVAIERGHRPKRADDGRLSKGGREQGRRLHGGGLRTLCAFDPAPSDSKTLVQANARLQFEGSGIQGRREFGFGGEGRVQAAGPQQTINVQRRRPLANSGSRYPRADDYTARVVLGNDATKAKSFGSAAFVAQPFMTIWMNQGETLDQALAASDAAESHDFHAREVQPVRGQAGQGERPTARMAYRRFRPKA